MKEVKFQVVETNGTNVFQYQKQTTIYRSTQLSPDHIEDLDIVLSRDNRDYNISVCNSGGGMCASAVFIDADFRKPDLQELIGYSPTSEFEAKNLKSGDQLTLKQPPHNKNKINLEDQLYSSMMYYPDDFNRPLDKIPRPSSL